jgi:paraquat-inducible protein B
MKRQNKFWSSWYVYIFPAFAAILIGGLLYQHYYHHGKFITITIQEASAISAEKTHLRFRGVNIGVVKELAISENHKEVIVKALLNVGTDDFAVKGARFWVVTPKVTLEGLSGLDTIFAGPYIDALPGPSDGPQQT